jgi:hypothetical protein
MMVDSVGLQLWRQIPPHLPLTYISGLPSLSELPFTRRMKPTKLVQEYEVPDCFETFIDEGDSLQLM